MICSYADDNHLVNESNCIDTLKVSLEKDAHRAISWFDNDYMDANPDKFQCISLDRFGRPPISISIEGNTIPSSDSIKILGVTLDSNLQYDTHISNLCFKASAQINAMKRIGKYLNTDCRIAMYKSFISSNFSYCPVSWIFCGKRNSDKLEKLQERALRFIFSDYTSPYRELLKHGHFLSLFALRIRYLAIEMYKCVHGIHDIYIYMSVYIYTVYVFVYIYYSIWNLSHHYIGFICSSVYHLTTCNFYWTISLYMWDLWCGMYCLRLILLWFLNPFSFFDVYFRKIR